MQLTTSPVLGAKQEVLLEVRNRTNIGRYAKVAASAVTLLLLGLVTSAALAADTNSFSALNALTGTTQSASPTISSDKADYPERTTTTAADNTQLRSNA